MSSIGLVVAPLVTPLAMLGRAVGLLPALSLVPGGDGVSQARPMYAPVRVSTRISSPSLMNKGT